MLGYNRCVRIAENCGVAPEVIENDYLVEAVLTAVSQDSFLSEMFVFRGGTCLHKVYFNEYRFSEDLDFIFSADISVNTVNTNMIRILEQLKKECPGILGWEEQKEKDRLQIFVNHNIIPENSKKKKQLKIDMCASAEMPGFAVKRLNLVYDEFISPVKTMRVCIPESIIADKISRIKSINKEARDIYDLKYLYESDVNPVLIEKEFRKNNFYGVGIKDLLDKIKGREFKTVWEKRLGHQMQNLPDFDEYIRGLQEVIKRKYKDLFDEE